MTFNAFFRSIQSSMGFAYSYLIYYCLPFHHRALRRIYSPFIRKNELCFDIGAHLGDRTRAWHSLGARVIAVEPNPGCMHLLRRWYGNIPEITFLEQAVGASSGTANLRISRLTPSVSTLSQNWLKTVSQSPRFAGVHWDEDLPVTVTTLDALIDLYGIPAFCKIDVEGAELDVLTGLARAIPALSFEYIPVTIGAALGCIERLGQLGNYEYNWRVSEWPRLRSSVWLNPQEMTAHLRRMSPEDDSGDIYARLIPQAS